jgi:transmembrane sensor
MNTPDPVTPSEPHDTLSERAAEFFGRRRCGVWTDADQAELDAWLAESTSQYVAYLRVEGIAARADQLAALRAFASRQAMPDSPDRVVKADNRRFVFPLLIAASVALFAAVGIPFVKSLIQPSDRIDSTDVGGRTLLKFVDGTEIELNTDTAMRFRMTTAERTVWLEKGEAWFHVSHDAAHPFMVIVGGHRITDLGTEFLVRRDADNIDVALLGGRAALSAEGVQTATLNPGDEATATPAGLSVTRRTPQELADELAWRRGMLVFRNAPLSEVVQEFNRYNKTKLVIADPSIAGEKIVANARTDDYEGFLQLARDVLKLRVDRKGDVILISRGQPDESKKAARVKRSL